MPICSRRALLNGIGLGGLSVLGAGALTACGPGEPGQVSIETALVPVGSGVIAEGYVILQPEAGSFHAFDARCPHADVLVTSVEADAIACRYHEATFDLASGEPIAGPAETGLIAAPVRVDGDLLVIG